MKSRILFLILTFLLLTAFANVSVFSQANYWEQTIPLGVSCFAFSGSNIFAGTANGVFLSTDGGTTWTQKNKGLTTTFILSLAAIGTNLYAGTYYAGGVFLSTDNGSSWTPINSGLKLPSESSPPTNINALVVSGSNLFAGTSLGVFVSSNGGTSWTPVISGLTNLYVTSLAVIGTNLFAGTGRGGIFLSTNNGTSWAPVDSGLTDPQILSLAVIGTNLFASTDFGGGVFLSTNNGTSWAPVNSGLTNRQVPSLAVIGPNLFAGSQGGGVFLSTNNGTSWLPTALTGVTVRSLGVNGTDLFASTTSFSYLSTNNGTSWVVLNSGLSNLYVYSLAVNGSNLVAGTGRGVFLSSNSGTSWTATSLPNLYISSLCFKDTNLYAGTSINYTGEPGGVFLSTDNGKTWSSAGLNGENVYSIAVIGANLFAGTRNGVYRSTNNDTIWTPVNSGLTNGIIRAFAVSGNDLFAGTSGGVFLSTDEGTNWTAVNSGLTNLSIGALAVSGTTLIAGTQYPGIVFRSTDNGTSWHETGLNLSSRNSYINAVAALGTNILVSSYNGPYLSNDDGTSWIWDNKGLNSNKGTSFARKGYMYLGSDDGVYRSLFPAGPGKDISVARILNPSMNIKKNTVFQPRILVHNYSFAPDTVRFNAWIGSSYSDSVIAILNPRSDDTVSFAIWAADSVGTFIATFSGFALGDEDTSDNSKTEHVVVYASALDPIVYDVYPHSGGNTGSVTITISGTHFRQKPIIKLVKVGDQNITSDSSSLQLIDSTTIKATLDLTNASLGIWNLLVMNPDSSQTTFYNAFSIEQGLPEELNNLWVNFIGRSLFRDGRRTVDYIDFGNSGNTNVYDVMLLLRLPVGFDLDVEVDTPRIQGIKWSTIPKGINIGSEVVFPIWISELSAFSSGRLRFGYQPIGFIPDHTNFTFQAELWQGEVNGFTHRGNKDDINESSIYAIMTNGYTSVQKLYSSIFTKTLTEFAFSLTNWLKSRRDSIDQVSFFDLAIAAFSATSDSVLSDSVINSIERVLYEKINYDFNDEIAAEALGDNLSGDVNEIVRKQDSDAQVLNNYPLDVPDIKISDVVGSARRRNHSCQQGTHRGIDITSLRGSMGVQDEPVYAIESGPVTYSGSLENGGNTVCIGSDPQICYMHMKDLPTVQGRVIKHQQIGTVSNTGCTGCPVHLHIQIGIDPTAPAVNPLDVIPIFRDRQTPGYNRTPDPNCPKPKDPKATTSVPRQKVSPGDPNDKVGSMGAGLKKYVANNVQLPYIIFFENVDTASAPAQIVVVTDTLDTTKVQLQTLALGSIGFGTHIVTPPQGSKQFSKDIDLRPADSLIVRINVSLDTMTGVLTWRFESLDPTTMLPPQDPLAGFLPPNHNPPEGEGSVSFTVFPKDNLGVGTEVRNKATIIFDNNPGMQTGEWINTIDNSKPTSRIIPFQNTQDSTAFLVSWVGIDTGSGIQSYTVYVREDTSLFYPWLVNVSDSSAVFNGLTGKKYSFYSVARDSVGNLESPKDTADAFTIVTDIKDASIPIPKEYALLQNYPNPFNPTTILEYQLPNQSNVKMKIYNLLGQLVATLIDGIQDAGYKSVDWNASVMASGVYFYRLEATSVADPSKAFTSVKKMLLVK